MTADIVALFDLCGWAEKGHLPSAGAVLDQTRSFMDGYELWKRERAAWGVEE